MGLSRTITTKVWKDRGRGKGFGYVSVRKKVPSCKKDTEHSSEPNESPAYSMLKNWLRSTSPATNEKTARGCAVLG